MSEKKVKDDIKSILRSHEPRVAWVMTVPTGYGRAGVEDFTCCAYGIFLAIEAKAHAKAKVSAMQDKRAKEIKLAGGIYIIIHDTNIYLLDLFLTKLRNKFEHASKLLTKPE